MPKSTSETEWNFFIASLLTCFEHRQTEHGSLISLAPHISPANAVIPIACFEGFYVAFKLSEMSFEALISSSSFGILLLIEKLVI